MPSKVQMVIARFRSWQEAHDAQQMRYLAQQWLKIENTLTARIENLAQYVYELQQAGKPVNMTSILRLEQYRDLLAQARVEVDKYNRFAAQQIRQSQTMYGKDGIDYTVESLLAAYADANRPPETITRLPVKAIETMIGFASDGTPLNKLLMADYKATITSLTQTLVDSTAMGINPRETARLMAKDMSGNLQRALTIARTEQNRTFRTAATMTAKESGVVDSWFWRSALQERTCMACLAMDGTEHALDEDLNDHPAGRCYKQFKIAGLEVIQSQSGAEWFATLDAGKQKELLGTGRYDAWQSGAVNFRDFAAITHDATWGDSVKIAPLAV